MNFQSDFQTGREFFFTSDNGYWKGVVVNEELSLGYPSLKQHMYAEIAIIPQEGQSAICINGRQENFSDPEQDVTEYSDAAIYHVTIGRHDYGIRAEKLVHYKPYEKTSYTNGVLTYKEQRTTEIDILHVEVFEDAVRGVE